MDMYDKMDLWSVRVIDTVLHYAFLMMMLSLISRNSRFQSLKLLNVLIYGVGYKTANEQ